MQGFYKNGLCFLRKIHYVFEKALQPLGFALPICIRSNFTAIELRNKAAVPLPDFIRPPETTHGGKWGQCTDNFGFMIFITIVTFKCINRNPFRLLAGKSLPGLLTIGMSLNRKRLCGRQNLE